MIDKEISVIGLGYIGLPTAALLANHGYIVNGMDSSEYVVNTLINGKLHITEPGLKEYVGSALKSKKLRVSNELKPADIYIICVPTPLKTTAIPEPDIKAVLDTTKNISKILKDGDIVILESTSPVGTTEKIASILEGIDIDNIHIAYCPERVMPGNILNELIWNDRVVGGARTSATELVSEFYGSFVSGKIHKTNSQTAEMCKLVENCYRDVNIAFANEVSLLCETNNIDANDLIELTNHHPRVNVLKPGIGVGGHCIAVDPWFLIAENLDSANLIHQARKTNTAKTLWVISKIESIVAEFNNKNNRNPVLGFFGLSYKANTDDLRESPAKYIVDTFIELGVETMIVEPNIENHCSYEIHSLNNTIDVADICIFLVDHEEFKSSVKDGVFKHLNIIDFCGITLNS